MASTHTPGLSLELQATGENNNTWGSLLNAVIAQIDRALAQRVTIAVTSSDVTLSATQSEYLSIKFNDTLAANRNVIFPAISKAWLIENATSGSFTLTCKTAAGTGVVIPQGKKAIILGDGTNIINAIDTVALTSILDSNGNELLVFGEVSSAVNEVKLFNAAAGNAPKIGSNGEANTGLIFVDSNGNEVLILGTVASAVNELTLTNAATGNRPKLQATGEANVGIDFQPKGDGILQLLDGNGNEVFKTAPRVASAINEIQATNAAAGNAPGFAATGGDTNIPFNIAGKGTGQFQAGGIDIAQILRGHLAGLTLSNNGSDATNDIDVAVGIASADDQSAMLYLSSAITKRLDASWAVGTNQGGLDTGSIADTTYHLWLIRRPDTGVVDVLFSASASSPTMPANYTQKRRIGAIIRASSAILAFTQTGDKVLLADPPLDVDVTNQSTTAVLRTLTVPAGIKVDAIINYGAVDDSANIYISSPDANDEAVSLTAAPLASMRALSSISPLAKMTVLTNTSAQVRTRADAAVSNLRIATLGWIDRRGRDD